jgi:hypothetical protein
MRMSLVSSPTPWIAAALISLSLGACGDKATDEDSGGAADGATDEGGADDSSADDSSGGDDGTTDGGATDGGATDGGVTDGATDGGGTDGATDGGGTDGATDGATDGSGTDGATDGSGTDGSGTDGGDGTTTGPDAVRGGELFSTGCAGCHGADGDSGYAPNLSVEVPGMSESALRTLIQSGQRSMPAVYPDATDAADVAAYVMLTWG